jgi:hypothetical protein
MSGKIPCCGQGTPESMIKKFNEMRGTFQGKQHPHTKPQSLQAMTTQTTFSQQASMPQFTSGGFLKYVRGNFGQK